MNLGQIVRRWGLAGALVVTSLISWQVAERGDTDVASITPIPYERSLATPMWSARRIPRTIQAPVVDDRVRSKLDDLINGSPRSSCLQVQVGKRIIRPASNVTSGLVPASNQKLLTTWAALTVLGPDFRFQTGLTADAVPLDGVINGNLYLIGDGDPFLTTEDWWDQYGDVLDGRHHTRFEDLVDRVVALGVTEITGRIIGDESAFDTVRQGPWADRLINSKQSGPLSALTLNEGFETWPSAPIGTTRTRSITENPPLLAASKLEQLLRENGVAIGASAEAGTAPASAVEITTLDSPTLLRVITHINSHSSNIGAELLLKKLGQITRADGSTAGGAEAVHQILTEAGIPLEGMSIKDGSGLAETNLVTCQAMAALLATAGPDSDFATTLAIGAERGTLLLRFVDTPAEGAVFAKTGTLNSSTALSGYVRSSTEPDVDLTFAYVANEEFINTLELQDAFVVALTAYPGRPTIDMLSPLSPTVN